MSSREAGLIGCEEWWGSPQENRLNEFSCVRTQLLFLTESKNEGNFRVVSGKQPCDLLFPEEQLKIVAWEAEAIDLLRMILIVAVGQSISGSRTDFWIEQDDGSEY